MVGNVVKMNHRLKSCCLPLDVVNVIVISVIIIISVYAAAAKNEVMNGEWVKIRKEQLLYVSNTAQYATLHCKTSQPRFELTLPKGGRQVHRCNIAFYTRSNFFTLTTHQTDTV